MGKKRETEAEMKERLKKEILEEMKENKSTEKVELDKKDQMRKDILDELNNNSNVNVSIDNNIQSFGPPKKSKVSFSNAEEQVPKKDNNKNTNNVKEEKTEESKEIINKKGVGLVVAIVLIAVVGILLFPVINNQIAKLRNSKKVDIKIEEPPKQEYPEITLKSEEVKNLKFPIMHVNNATKNTHYKDDRITVSSFSNAEILYNALADVYSGFVDRYKGAYDGKFCAKASQAVSIDSRYIKLRIEDIFGKQVNYKYDNLTIPVSSFETDYVGTWKYNRSKDKFIYHGDCSNSQVSQYLYYDIRVPYEANSDEKNTEIYVYDYVAFAFVNRSNNAYILYSDNNYTNEISRGILTTNTNKYEEELTSIVNKIDKSNLKKYKNTFTVHNCSYSDRYCFLSGEWQK